jgi:major membrane immunogen (membrane-anchored lipoprotein)
VGAPGLPFLSAAPRVDGRMNDSRASTRLDVVSAATYSEQELIAAVEALADTERFREAEQLVTKAAPSLQTVLAQALASGGWFEDQHQGAILEAASKPDSEERIAAVKTLLAEESRIAMMIGVAVGWALAGELGRTNEPRRDDQ